jgi:hypothetical protein
LPETSARSPIDTNADSPSERRAGLLQERPGERPGLRQHADAAGGGDPAANVACSRTAGSVLTTPMAFGPDEAHAAVARESHDLLEPLAALRPAVGEAARDDDEPRDVLVEQPARPRDRRRRARR